MAVPERLIACKGRWNGVNTLHDPHTKAPDESASTAIVTPLLKGTFLRLDYTWEYDGEPQDGSLLIGGVAAEGVATAHWVDTWHMGEDVLACTGERRDHGGISVCGTYAAPPGPDWGWRIELIPQDGDALRIQMFNVTPDGVEAPAVEAAYRRVS